MSEILQRNLLSVILFSFTLFLGCEENPSGPTVDPNLDISMSSLDFGSEYTELTFKIGNQGVGTLEWSITSSTDWISYNPDAGTTTTESDVVTVSVNRDDLSAGSYDGVIVVTPDTGSSQSITIQLVVPAPELSISVTDLEFNDTEDEFEFTISNTGGGILKWNISETAEWLTISPRRGETSTETEQISVTVNRNGLSAGDYSRDIIVYSNVGERSIAVNMYKGLKIREYNFNTNNDLDEEWICLSEGNDFWGIVNDQNRGPVVWCNGRGDHTDGLYNNNMFSTMRLKPEEEMDVRQYSEVVIQFWMYYETQEDDDYVNFFVRGDDDNWYFKTWTQWSGSNSSWMEYAVNLSDWGDIISEDFLRFGFGFTSNHSTQFAGAFIDGIEIWAIE
ncbi:MAG: BACON domain-containing protein [Calditrichaeota bacterium]|nr:BACON domain-containing protein [Calditrichota bacterium]